jgi:lipoprotein NlpI
VAGRIDESREVHARAVSTWEKWLSLRLKAEARAEAHIYAAKSFFALGETTKAMTALEQAIDVKPDRKETYADVIAILTTYGHLPEALDAYHRALGRQEVSEYLKTYCSFWIIGLAGRAGIQPDDLAMEYLGSLSGDAWYIRLAQLFLGTVSFEALLAEAETVGKRAELYYYWADHLLARGEVSRAKALWKKVLTTEMMAFYEYDMASYNLRNGPAKVSTRPHDRQRAP